MIKKLILLGVTIIMGIVLVLNGCSAQANETDPNLIGWIDGINQPQGEKSGQISVNSPDNNTSDKFMITVTDKTQIYTRINSEKDQKVGFNDFNAGQKVEVWFSGPVMESYPAQVSAGKILITEEPASQTMPPLNDGVKSILVEVTCDEFASTPHITKEIEITFPGSLVVSLCSNPSTGFEWEEVNIGDESLIYQTEHNYVSPEASGIVGAAGKDVWSFNSASSGQSTLTFKYSRPWDGGEKSEWTLTLNVEVK
ncbi:MAG TPA: DUF3221 domain-containing protein [Dehalococcoidia bacterium]|nr:DUF3221 domain-containing protein [Dehalococcoidia bacterium]